MIPTTQKHLIAWVQDKGTQVKTVENYFSQLLITYEDRKGTQIKVVFDSSIPTRWEIILQSKVNHLDLKFKAA